MLDIPEYDLDRPDTLKVLQESDVISPSEAEAFRQRLVDIAGKTLTGQPRLALRWGPTYCDPMSTDRDAIKYLDFTQEGQQLGERRFFIEIHRTPEFLEKSGRYQLTTRQDPETGEKLLKSLPSEGCYDYWLRLERVDRTYHPPDGEALEGIRRLWEWEQLPQNQRDALEQAEREVERRREIQLMRQQTRTHLHFGSGLILPPQYR